MKKYLLIFLMASVAQGATKQIYDCDMRELITNDVIAGGVYQVLVSADEAVLTSGVFASEQHEVATLLKDASSKSSTLFLNNNENGQPLQTFDLLPSGEAGVLIWRTYSWQNPENIIADNVFVHICNKR